LFVTLCHKTFQCAWFSVATKAHWWLYYFLDKPLKGTKIPKLMKKVPDFTNIHQKQFEKMESVVDCHKRKHERAKMLLSSKTPQVR
jgi:hypothetical protein